MCYFYTFFFSLLFRMVLIRFSERGLVDRGKPSLLLFQQLYWTVFGAFFFLSITSLTIVPFLQGTYPDTPHSKMCMLTPTENMTSEINIKKSLIFCVFPLILATYQQLVTYRVRKYVSGLCPNSRMGAIGKYRRNLIDFEANSRYIFYWMVHILLVVAIRKLASMFPGISPVTMFRIYQGNQLVFIWCIHGIVLPLTMKIPWKAKWPRKPSSFYVHKPPLYHPEPQPQPPTFMTAPVIPQMKKALKPNGPMKALPFNVHKPLLNQPRPQPKPPTLTTTILSPQALSEHLNFPLCSSPDGISSPSPIPSQILHQKQLIHCSIEQEVSRPQTIFYSHQPWSPIYKEKEENFKFNAIFMTSLTKRKEDDRGPESESFKCELCSYECDTYLTFKKHKKTRHGFIQHAVTQKEDMSSEGDSNTPEPTLTPIPSSKHRDRQGEVEALAARGPQRKFNQASTCCKRGNHITPSILCQTPPSMNSPVPLRSTLPSSQPTRTALRNTKYQQGNAATGENYASSKDSGRHHDMRLTKLKAQTNREDLPSVD